MIPSKTLLGLGGCVDLEIDFDEAVLSRLAQQEAIAEAEVGTRGAINSERALVVALLGFIRDGRGGERAVCSSGIISEFAARFRQRLSLGGTGTRAAGTLSLLGRRCTVHVATMNSAIAAMLPAGASVLAGSRSEEIFPHLIVQYPADAQVKLASGTIRANRANRVIFIHDPDSATLALSPQLPAELAQAQTILLSGFNAMTDPALLTERLRTVRSALLARRSGGLVMYEDAGFHFHKCREVVTANLAGLLDVHSMNEDELRAYLGREVSLSSTAQVLAALSELRQHLGCRTVVIHTERWALAFGSRPWHYRQSLRWGVAAATARYWKGDGCTAADIAATAALKPGAQQRELAEALIVAGQGRCQVVPVPEIASAASTVGLGDSFVGGFLSAVPMAAAGGFPRPR